MAPIYRSAPPLKYCLSTIDRRVSPGNRHTARNGTQQVQHHVKHQSSHQNGYQHRYTRVMAAPNSEQQIPLSSNVATRFFLPMFPFLPGTAVNPIGAITGWQVRHRHKTGFVLPTALSTNATINTPPVSPEKISLLGKERSSLPNNMPPARFGMAIGKPSPGNSCRPALLPSSVPRLSVLPSPTTIRFVTKLQFQFGRRRKIDTASMNTSYRTTEISLQVQIAQLLVYHIFLVSNNDSICCVWSSGNSFPAFAHQHRKLLQRLFAAHRPHIIFLPATAFQAVGIRIFSSCFTRDTTAPCHGTRIDLCQRTSEYGTVCHIGRCRYPAREIAATSGLPACAPPCPNPHNLSATTSQTESHRWHQTDKRYHR